MFDYKKIKKFEFKEYQICLQKDDLVLSLVYALDDIQFQEILSFPVSNEVNINDNALERAAQFVHYMLGVSYYKAAVPKDILCRTKPDQSMASFLDQTYFQGLQEFAYINQIDLSDRIKFPYSSQNRPVPNDYDLQDQILLPMGGGKDSLLCLEILKDENPSLITLGTNPMVREIADYYQVELIEIERKIDPKLFELNQQGALNGHVPFSAILAAAMSFAALIYRSKYIVLANEKSASEGNCEFLGQVVNHQYSKSFEFEVEVNQIIKSKVHPGIHYFSLLRQFSEIKIAKELSNRRDLLGLFSSCNQNKKLFQNDQRKWCCNCAKCSFVFLTLAPLLSSEELVKIFGENLFEQESLIPIFQSLCGLDQNKPFECVGEYEESQTLFSELIQNKQYLETPVVAEIKSKLPNDNHLEQFLNLSPENNIPEFFQTKLNAFLG